MKRMHGLHSHKPAPQTAGRTIRWAVFYDIAAWLLTLGRERAMRETTADMAQLRPGDKVLDVGCGTGNLTIAAKVRVGPTGEVHGIDAAPEMIDVACRKAIRAGVNVAFQVGLIEAIPFPDDTFDVVLSSLMIHHLPGDLKRNGFREIFRVLKPGGHLLVVDFEPPTHPVARVLGNLVFRHMMQIDVREYQPMMEEAGFIEVAVGRTKYKTLSFVRGKAGKPRPPVKCLRPSE